jgi:uncharacterized membrane protein YoaK (UPF0700 family)
VSSSTSGPEHPDDGSNAARQLSFALAALLAFGAGGIDAFTFARLGNVFGGVMTGNLVILGLSIGTGKAVVAGRASLAIVAFIVGVYLAGRITRDVAPSRIWPRQVTRVLFVEGVILAALIVGWEVVGTSPKGSSQALLLAASALAMGLQSGAVVTIGISGLSTTYLTGTLTGVLTNFAHSGRIRTQSVVIVASLLIGAITMALVISHIPRFAPVLPLGAVILVVAAAQFDKRLQGHGV